MTGSARKTVLAAWLALGSVLIPGVSPAAQETTLAASGRDPAQFPAYVEQLKRRAREQGISQATLDRAFAQIHFVDRVIKADRNQPEQKITLDDYLRLRCHPPRCAKGENCTGSARRNGRARAIVIEYRGAISSPCGAWRAPTGRFRGVKTWCLRWRRWPFEGRREAFFSQELMAALQIVEQGHVGDTPLKGSWAGAMGQCQFMPSSFLRYAADGDGDGRIDIWNNIDDVFASTASYLSKEGWQPGIGWGREVKLPAGFNRAELGLKDAQARSVNAWQRRGVRRADGSALPHAVQRGWIIAPDDLQGRAFLVYDNFRILMHWNRSYYFAITVGMMADAIGH